MLKKRLKFLPVVLPLLSLPIAVTLGITVASFASPETRFLRASEKLFQEEMTANTLNMHYTIACPENYGISDYTPVLPAYDKEARPEATAALQAQVDFYAGLDSEDFSPENAHTLQLLQTYLQSALELSLYPYYEEPLSPSSGMQSQLPILLAEYPFRTLRDVEDYLAILDQTDEYFLALLDFETEKKEAGLLCAATSLLDTAEGCRSIMNREDLTQGQHFLQLTFRERLQPLLQKGLLDHNQAKDYIARNDCILSDFLLPAYHQLADGLEELADPDLLLRGLAAYPEGQAYYEALLRSETGSYRSVEEISQLLTGTLQSEMAQLTTLVEKSNPYLLTRDAWQTCNDMFPIRDGSKMLTDLQKRLGELFPPLPETGLQSTATNSQSAVSGQPGCRIKTVASSLQDYCAPAFYLTPPLDATEENSIYINPKSTIAPVDLYTTLAHEGYPGHMYQTVYANRLLAAQDTAPVSQLLWFGGYLEGWALYVEFLAYDEAAQLMKESGSPEFAALIQTEKHNRSAQLCLYSLLDIMIHHENADLQDTAEFLEAFGITNSASVSAIYKYIVEEPCNYLKYYLGYLEILALRDTCRELWGEAYSDLRFHRFFLDWGPADFRTLHQAAHSSSMRSK